MSHSHDHGSGAHDHGSGAHDHGSGSHGHFRNVEEFVAKFDDPSRDEWQKPEDVLNFIGLKTNDKIADIGAGTGYFSIRAAKRVQNGLVYSIDSEQEMLNYLEKRAASNGLSNIKVCKSDGANMSLPELVDVVLLVNAFHHIHDRTTYFTKLKENLRPGGKVIIIEGKNGTQMEPPEEFRMEPGQITKDLTEANYELIAESDILPYQSLQMFSSVDT